MVEALTKHEKTIMNQHKSLDSIELEPTNLHLSLRGKSISLLRQRKSLLKD